MGNKKGYIPSEESKRKVSEALKKAYSEGRHRKRTESPTDEANQKASESLKKAWADGKFETTLTALKSRPKMSEDDSKARRLVRQKKRYARDPGYYVKYGLLNTRLSAEEYNKMSEAQDHKCAICGKPEVGKRLAVDHDHKCCPTNDQRRKSCGKCIRGLLCSKCNCLLGNAMDDRETLLSALKYLDRYTKE